MFRQEKDLCIQFKGGLIMFRQEKDLCETCKYYDHDEMECPYHYIDDDYAATVECDEYKNKED